jgi:hypothetical protein
MGNDGTVYISGSYGIYRSTFGCNDTPPTEIYTNVSAYSIISTPDGSIFAVTGSSNEGVIKSTDKGVTWNQINSGLNVGIEYNTKYSYYTSAIEDIVYDPITEHLILLDKMNGLYRSTDLGAKWHKINNGLPTIKVDPKSLNIPCVLAINPTTGMLFVGYQGYMESENLIYRSTPDIPNDHQVISVDEPEDIPTTYSLSQNYPNPFNPTTTIQYAIPKDEFVKLTVYDITGKIVKELVSGHNAAGKYSVEFNASNYSSGTYYYKLEAGEYKNIQKMMLVK